MNTKNHESILSKRYASKPMSALFSEQTKFSTWRKVWIALAKSQSSVGIAITPGQIAQLEKHKDIIDIKKAAQYESELHHDVMAHIHTYAEQCPDAAPIIHLGATSCLVTDNAELIIMRNALSLLQTTLKELLSILCALAQLYKDVACLSYTHLQPAQPTTLGKRFCIWLHDFYIDYVELNQTIDSLQLLGLKGATGTQATFLQLCNNDQERVKKLERLFCKELGFEKIVPIAGQTYTRKQDIKILTILANIATSAQKMCTDLRLLAHLQEIEEPIATNQVGSSAMPYKRNPMLSERVCSLARYVINLTANPYHTAASQWLERSLDDSANRRLCIPDAFMATDAILHILIKLSGSLSINKPMITAHLKRELPFMATEALLMACVQKGADRQIIHERIRLHCRTVQQLMKEQNANNELLEYIAQDPDIPLSGKDIAEIFATTNFTGRAAEQVDDFLQIIKTALEPLGTNLDHHGRCNNEQTKATNHL